MFGSNTSNSIIETLRSQLSLSTHILPKFSNMDAELWSACLYALTEMQYLSEFSWIAIGASLLAELRSTPSKAILVKFLSQQSNCSFIPSISENEFLENFGRRNSWNSIHSEYKSNYFQSRFASIYWSCVRDFAVKSKLDCISIFHLPSSIVDVIADSTTSEIIDFTHGMPHLQKFSLRCNEDDCIRIANLVKDEKANKNQLLIERLIKANHSATFESNHCSKY